MHEALFVDTGYVVALLNKDDKFRQVARKWAVEIAKKRIPLVTSTLTFVELGDRFTEWSAWTALQLALDAHWAKVDMIEVGAEVLARAVALKNTREDKRWGITDCTSFVLMQDRGITKALSCDQHFQQTGFEALLIE